MRSTLWQPSPKRLAQDHRRSHQPHTCKEALEQPETGAPSGFRAPKLPATSEQAALAWDRTLRAAQQQA